MPEELLPFGRRVRILRERAGKSRAVLGGLVGRSEEWVKSIETGKILTPRLPMLLHLAEVLGVKDLAELTGSQSLPVASVTKAGHPGTDQVAEALARTVRPTSAARVTERLSGAWSIWHGSSTERTAIAAVLPQLIIDARAVARALDGVDRRRALAELAQVYHLTQLFLAHQPAVELVWLAADRAMTAAQDADDPNAIAVAAWYYGHVYRGNGQPDAAETVLGEALDLVDPEAGAAQRVRWGQLHLGLALGHAKSGNGGTAWRHWDHALDAARALGAGYVHPWLMFGPTAVEAYGISIDADLQHPGEAVRRADAVELGGLPSRTRRASYLIDSARAHRMGQEHVAVVHLLGKAMRESVETVRHSTYARQATLELMERRGSVREDARELALAMGLLGVDSA
jgi:transcriptional regulator with XRE-family HTH domain